MCQPSEIVPAAAKPVLVCENSPTMGAKNVKAMSDAYKASVVAAAAHPTTNDGAVAVATEAKASVRDLRMRFERRQAVVAPSPRVGRLNMNRFGRFGVVASPEEERQQVREAPGDAASKNENKVVVEEQQEKEHEEVVVEEEKEKKSEVKLATAVVVGKEDAKFAVGNLSAVENLLVDENLLAAGNSLASDSLLAVMVEVDEHQEEKVLAMDKADGKEAERVVVDEKNVKDKKDEGGKGKMLVVGTGVGELHPCIFFATAYRVGPLILKRRDQVEVFKQIVEENEHQGEDDVVDSSAADDKEDEEELAVLEDNSLWEDVDEIVAPATRLQGAVATAKDVFLALGEYVQAAIDWIINGPTAAIQYLTGRAPAQDERDESATECAIPALKEEDDDAWGVNPVYGFFI